MYFKVTPTSREKSDEKPPEEPPHLLLILQKVHPPRVRHDL